MSATSSYRDTNITSCLERKLSQEYSAKGTSQPIYIPLWLDVVVAPGAVNGIIAYLNKHFPFLGLNPKVTTTSHKLVVHYSSDTGYTLEGPSFRDITANTSFSLADLYSLIVEYIVSVYQNARGWERELEEQLAELEAL